MTKFNYKTFIGIVVMTFFTFFIAYLGVYALQKSMSVNMGFTIQPNVRCELYANINGSEYLVFSNRSGAEFIHNEWTLSESTSTLTYSKSLTGTLGGSFDLIVKNYTPNVNIIVETAGNGVSYNSILLNAFENIENISQETLTVATASNQATINFIPLNNYYITPSFEHATFDLNAENNTLIKFGNNYYIPLGVNATTTIVPETNYEYATLSSLTIDGVNKLANYFNAETNVLNIPLANINGQILTTGGIYPYNISFNKQGGTGGTASTTAYLGHTPSSSITPPTKTNYSFGGYYYDNHLDSYVQDNMLMWLDGIYNNGVGNSHSTTATSWRDISGNNLDCGFNGTAPTWNSTNGISLDGSDDGIYIGDQLQDLFKSNNTCEFLFKKLDADNDRIIIMGNHYQPHATNYEIHSGNNLRIWFDDKERFRPNTNAVSYNEFVSFTFAFDKPNGLITVYKNGILLNQNLYTGYTTYNYNFTTAWLGRDNRTGTTCLEGNFYSFRAYNRVLTATEVAQNYDVDIARYGTSGTQTVVSPTQIFNASGIGTAIWNYARNSILYARWS